MRKLMILLVPAVLALGTSCNPAGALCEKEYDCQTQLGLTLEDDYPAVCKARLEGADATLRANAEKPCEDLANAFAALAACESVLSCEDLAASRAAPATDNDKCKDLRQGQIDAFAAADNGAACDGVANAGGEGEGEGEGE
jgi:hypothetical protein